MNFQQQYQEYLSLIEQELQSYMQQIVEKSIVSEAMSYSLMNGGKRIRPVLLLAFCRMLGGDVRAALPYACALEMIHTCSLIHDDLPCMDDDDIRRGKPSCHKQFGEAYALLAGDALLNLAYEVLFGKFNTLSIPIAVACGRILSDSTGIDGMIAGQTIDLLSENTAISLEALKKLHALKTGKLLTAPCLMGVICAGGNEADKQRAITYGQTIGLQFQIVDDILDITGSTELLGKPVGSDEENHKSTYVSIMGLEQSRKEAEALGKLALEQLECYGNEAEFLKELTMQLCNRNN